MKETEQLKKLMESVTVNEDYASNFDNMVNEVIGMIRNEIRENPDDEPQVIIATMLEDLVARVHEELKDWSKNTVINH